MYFTDEETKVIRVLLREKSNKLLQQAALVKEECNKQGTYDISDAYIEAQKQIKAMIDKIDKSKD